MSDKKEPNKSDRPSPKASPAPPPKPDPKLITYIERGKRRSKSSEGSDSRR